MLRSSYLRSVALAVSLVAAWPLAASAQCTNWSDLASLGYAGDATFYAPQPDTGELYVGTRCWCGYHGERLPGLVRWNGTGWTRFEQADFFDNGGDIFGMAVIDLGAGIAPHIWGTMSTFPHIGAFLRWTGTTWVQDSNAPPGLTHALLSYDDGSGARWHAATTTGVYRWDAPVWTLLGDLVAPGSPSTMVVHDDGQGPALYVAGQFTSVAGLPAQGIARWDGAAWTALGAGVTWQQDSWIPLRHLRSVQEESGPALYAAGALTSAGGSPANGVARWNGTSWTALGSGGPPRAVNGIAWFDDGAGSGPALVISGYIGGTYFCDRWAVSAWVSLPAMQSAFGGGPLAVLDVVGSPEPDLIGLRGIYSDDIRRPVVLESCGVTGTLSCFGDGSTAPCPCGNDSASAERAGCRHSLGTGGALRGRGTASLSADSFALDGSTMTNSSALYFQAGSQHAPVAFGDGLKCTGGPFVRFATKQNASGASRYPVAGELPISQRGHITAPGTRHYQVRYRNSADFCTSATFNYTNAVSVIWGA